MENLEDRTRDLTPEVRDDLRGGPNLDGIDNGRDVNGNGVRNGVINDGTVPNETIINDGNTTTPNETIIDDNRNNR